MLFVYLLGVLLLCAQFYALRSGPIALHSKLKRSIEVYEITTQQIEGVEQRMHQLSVQSMEETLLKMKQRKQELSQFIMGLIDQYDAIYQRPIKRRILALPAPPLFRC